MTFPLLPSSVISFGAYPLIDVIRHPLDAGFAEGENVFTEQAPLAENCRACAVLAVSRLSLDQRTVVNPRRQSHHPTGHDLVHRKRHSRSLSPTASFA
jgi:hypothetical protein